MDEPKLFCRRCKQLGDFAKVEESVVCPNCGQKYKPSELNHAAEEISGCLQAFFLVFIDFVCDFSDWPGFYLCCLFGRLLSR